MYMGSMEDNTIIANSLLLDRINEVEMVCERDNPIYEQISSFSVALYVLGYFDAPDLMSVEDLDESDASEILKETFIEVNENEIPSDYNIEESKDRYLLVMGDKFYPEHFAVVVDNKKQRPFFSKLRYFGSGYDSLPELFREFPGEDKNGTQCIQYYKQV